MQPLGIICWFESKDSAHSNLLSNLFENVCFKQSESDAIYLWSEPVEVLDQDGSTIKCFVLNWQWKDSDEDIKNSLLAFWVLLSSWLKISNEQDLPRVSSLINSLSEEECYESEQELVELLPSLTFIVKEGEDTLNEEITSWNQLESLIALSSDAPLDSLRYLPNKDICKLPDKDTTTPFWEGVQDIRRKISNFINPIKLGGYCVNGRMYWDMVSIVVDHINTGALPKFQDMFLTIINKEVNINLEEAKLLFKTNFTDNLSSGLTENKIDELYHYSINSVMRLFRRQLDPYLNIGEEIDMLFSEFLQIHNASK